MSSQIDLAIAVGLFLTFVGLIIVYITSYMMNYSGLISISELRTAAYNIFKTFFTSKGVPSSWETNSYTPIKIGLITDMYRMPIMINNTNGTNFNNITMNISINFDTSCENTAWNDTIRMYDEDNQQIPLQLYNSTFCSEQYINKSDIVFNTSIVMDQNKILHIYFSNDENVTGSAYVMPFPNMNATNYTVIKYPKLKLTTISVAKLKALKNLSYDEVVRTIGNYKFYVEVSET